MTTTTRPPLSPLPPLLRRYRVDLVLLLVAVVWGGSYLSAKVLTEQASVTAVLALRFLVAAALLVIVWLVRRERMPSRRAVGVGLLLGATQASILWLETQGVAFTSATNAGLIISLTIILTPVLESVAGRRWLPRPFFVAAVLAVVGVALLVSGNGFAQPNVGDLLILAAALVRALHVTMLGHLTRARSDSTITLTLLQALVGAVVFTALDVPGLVAAVTTFDLAAWIGVLYLGLACSVFAFLAQLWAIRRTSAARASLLMGTEPIWAVLVGVSLGSETLGLVGAVGAALIIAGTFWGQRIEAGHRLRSR
ncbi:DMT family transporter [Cryobacterium melibiosiphilum]|uniref:DMT family transporter n=1 Tax=Cryobacterium melibiosiphilum TaxID=995039 RepID=A0A3A5M991_9MICO|nr:DMT family transporter [Cryobacterium melibiosiphilum]RJT86128.1 DMT family transporter [Cryobacterium melibiosiphilum]